MRQLIDELKAVPGVVGAGLYSTSEGLQVTNLPGIFKPERLDAMGKHLGKLYSAGRLNFSDLTDVTLNYDESVVVVRGLDQQMLLFVFCDPSFNHNLLNMSLNLLQEDYLAGNFKTAGPVFSLETAGDESAPKAGGPAAGPEGPLSQLLEALRERLTKVLGPMAGFVFDEAVEGWQEKGADSSRVGELLEAISAEIGDEEKIERYRQLIAEDLATFKGG